MSIQESIDMDQAPQLSRLFRPDILGKLPSTGRSRIRRTALGVIGMILPRVAENPSHTTPRCLLLMVCEATACFVIGTGPSSHCPFISSICFA